MVRIILVEAHTAHNQFFCSANDQALMWVTCTETDALVG